jgi:hypothetical protein
LYTLSVAESFQNVKCNNINLNINYIDQTQVQRQVENNNFGTPTTNNQQLIPTEDALDSLIGDNSNGKSLLNINGNNVNVCFNNNDNEQDTELIGTQEQIEQPTPTPSADYLDLAVANIDSDNVSILLGDGTGSFITPNNFDTGDAPISIAVADFNSDGELDLAVANIISDDVSILLGNSDGTFGTANNFLAGNSPYSVAIGDFNSDMMLDLVTANEAASSNDVSILLGNGDGTFGTAANFPAGGTTPRSVAVGDFNSDGELDLAVANTGSDNISILLGNGDGTFGTANTFATGEESFPSFIAVSDLDNDNVLDLVTTYANTGGS